MQCQFLEGFSTVGIPYYTKAPGIRPNIVEPVTQMTMWIRVFSFPAMATKCQNQAEQNMKNL